MIEREHHIKTLENLLSHYKAREKCEGYYDSTLKDNVEALHYVILSLKTDLKYDLMYEGEEIYTKADMITMLEDLKKEMNPIKECEYQIYGKEHWNFTGKCQDVVQQKINALRGDKDDMRRLQILETYLCSLCKTWLSICNDLSKKSI